VHTEDSILVTVALANLFVVVQNMRVMSKYYTRIRMLRMAELLDLTEDVSIHLVEQTASLVSVCACL